MVRKEYSAGMVKLSFWFSEFRKVIQLINDGYTLSDIKKMNLEENIFLAPSQERAIQIFNTVSTRVKSVDNSFYTLFEKCDISNQKLITLISIMQSDSLFFDFVYEVYREKLILGIDELTDSDFSIFFKNKQLQSEKVAKWKDYTLYRLSSCYKTMLMEADVIDNSKGIRKIIKPILDKSLEDNLNLNGMEDVLNALTGVR